MDWFMKLFTIPTFEWLEPWITNDLGTGHKFCLSVTSAAENLTAGFAEMIFQNKELMQQMPKDVQELYLWHAAEEIEHRHLAFELFQKVDGSYLGRMWGAVVAYSIILLYVVIGTIYMLLQDKTYRWSSLPFELFRLVTDPKALGKIAIDGFIDYARTDFHPNDISANPDALQYLEKMAS